MVSEHYTAWLETNGGHVPGIVPEDRAVCRVCDAEISRKWYFCPNCGNSHRAFESYRSLGNNQRFWDAAKVRDVFVHFLALANDHDDELIHAMWNAVACIPYWPDPGVTKNPPPTDADGGGGGSESPSPQPLRTTSMATNEGQKGGISL